MRKIPLDLEPHPLLKKVLLIAAANMLLLMIVFAGGIGRSTVPTDVHRYEWSSKGRIRYYRPVVARYIQGSFVLFFGTVVTALVIARK